MAKLAKTKKQKEKENRNVIKKAGHQLPPSIDQAAMSTMSASNGSPDYLTVSQAIEHSEVENAFASSSKQFLCVASINNDPNDHCLPSFFFHIKKATQLQSIIGHKLNRDKSTKE